jgi:uncharacterized protein YxjI
MSTAPDDGCRTADRLIDEREGPMAPPPAPDGFTRFLVRSKLGVGRDFVVLDPQTEEQVFLVDGKWGLRPRAEVQDSAGAVVAEVRGTATGFKKELTITDASGEELASLKGKLISPVRNSMTVTLPSGEQWLLQGSIMERSYRVTSGDRTVIDISQKWVTVRDTFTLDVADEVPTVLALAVLWGVDRFAEQR